MSYATLTREFGRYGWSYMPVSKELYRELLTTFKLTQDEMYSVGCDLAAGFSLEESIEAMAVDDELKSLCS